MADQEVCSHCGQQVNVDPKTQLAGHLRSMVAAAERYVAQSADRKNKDKYPAALLESRQRRLVKYITWLHVVSPESTKPLPEENDNDG